MTRSIADLSWDELEALANEAGAEAIARAHAAGLSTSGCIDGVPTLSFPDGTIVKAEAADAPNGTTTSSELVTPQRAVARFVA